MSTATHFFLFFLFVLISKFVKNKNTAILSAEQQLNQTAAVNKGCSQGASFLKVRHATVSVCACVCKNQDEFETWKPLWGRKLSIVQSPTLCTFPCLCILCHFLPVDLVTTTKISFLLFSFSRFSDFLEMEEPLKSNICSVSISLSLLTIGLESDDRALNGTEEILNLAVRLAFLKA